MSAGASLLDLVILVPGKDEEATMATLLSMRRQSLRIREVAYRILVHPRRDPGCFLEAADLLQPYQAKADHALVLFDHAGSGQENRSPEDVEAELNRRLANSGWHDRAAVVVIVPELEAWVWSDSPEVDIVLCWEGRSPGLREWLRSHDLLKAEAVKPYDPKRAVERALREARIPRSSAIYGQLASTVSLERCNDPGFLKLKSRLRSWFGREALG